MPRAVRRSVDFDRVSKLEKKRPYPADIVERFTAALQSPGGTDKLRPVQAEAFYEMALVSGLFGPIKVGAGKTLISLIAPLILKANRPVLLLPAALIEKTERERERYAQHFRVARHIRFISYEMLGRVRMAEELERYQPDLIIADECHRLKNQRAACTRRVARFMANHPQTKFVALSGTIMKHSVKDFAHILKWCLKDKAPVPLETHEVDEWAEALDDPTGQVLYPMDPGPLGADQTSARAWFRDRLLTSPGVVAYEGKDTDASLRINALIYPVNSDTEAAFKTLRENWATPTGFTFIEAIMLWKFARELALGHWIEWDPPAPVGWLMARKGWAHHAREVLSRSRKYDTELQIRQAVTAGDVEGLEILQAWEAVKDEYTPSPKDRWHDDSALDVCQKWADGGPGIIFTGHSFFGRALAKRINAPYYGEEGKDENGNPIENEKGNRVIVASLQANGTGRNLQAFSRALVTTNLNGGDALEQLLGRLHRQGQLADEVEFTFLVGCYEHIDGFWRAFESTQTLGQLTGGAYKLMFADIVFPTKSDIKSNEYRWKHNV